MEPISQFEVDIDEFIIRSYVEQPTDEEKTTEEQVPKVIGRDNYTQYSGIIQNFDHLPDVYMLDGIVLPDLTKMHPVLATEAVADVIRISDDETNLKSFWIVDILTHCLIQVQKKGMNQSYQKALIHWFFYILRFIDVYNWSREETFSLLRLMFLRAERIVLSKSHQIPTPEMCSTSAFHTSSSEIEEDDQEKDVIDRNLHDLGILIDIVYSIFADQFKYEVIRAAFANFTYWETIEFSNAISFPKPLQLDVVEKAASKEKKGKEKQLKETIESVKAESLMQSGSRILPLIKAVEQKFFDDLFPQTKQDASSLKKKQKNANEKLKGKRK